MVYEISFTLEAEEHLIFFSKNDKRILKKINDLIEDTINHPKEGIGKPERLKYKGVETYLRRINKCHRMVYFIDDDKHLITILSLNGHYGNK